MLGDLHEISPKGVDNCYNLWHITWAQHDAKP